MKKTLKELLFAYRDRLFVAACNKNSIKWIEKLLELEFIEIVKKEDPEEEKSEEKPSEYSYLIFKATPSFIDYYRSHTSKEHVMRPIKPGKYQ